MSWDSREKRRAYQSEWIARRREEWLADKVCEVCGSREGLCVVGAGAHGGALWSASDERRQEMLVGARVLCRSHFNVENGARRKDRLSPLGRALGIHGARRNRAG